MKQICITYNMSRMIGNAADKEHYTETAENCITTCFTDEVAATLLEGRPTVKMENWLESLAQMQGYCIARFCVAEEE